jgi:hypothetical protein
MVDLLPDVLLNSRIVAEETMGDKKEQIRKTPSGRFGASS